MLLSSAFVATAATLVFVFALHVTSAAAADIRGVRLFKQTGSLTASASASASGIPRSPHLDYFGGPVISSVEVTMIQYGNLSPAASAWEMEGFYTGVVKSPYMDCLSEYNTTTQVIKRGKYMGTYKVPNPIRRRLIYDSKLQTFLRALVSSGIITPNANSYYPIHFAPGQTIYNSRYGASCRNGGFCTYHGTIDISNISSISKIKYLKYSVNPDMGGPCLEGCASSTATTQFNLTCFNAAHEMMEAITDPAGPLATSYAKPLAWLDPIYGEIADICENGPDGSILGANGMYYTVAKLWSNQENACIVTRSTP